MEIRWRGCGLSRDGQERVERRVRFTLGRFGSRVERVSLCLKDVNGPRGGVDQECRVTATVYPWGGATVLETDSNLEIAVDRAIHRLGRSVARLIERRRTTRASATWRPASAGSW